MTVDAMVLGHRNPDNDSIISAVSFAYLRNALEERESQASGVCSEYHFVPGRLGPCPPETAWVLKENGFPEPELVTHIFARARDVMTSSLIQLNQKASILQAAKLLRKHDIRCIVVTDDDGAFCGLFSNYVFAKHFMTSIDVLEEGNEEAFAKSISSLANHTVGEYMKTDVVCVCANDMIDSFSYEVKNTPLHAVVVLDDNNQCIGIITRSDISHMVRRKVVLVDHNEKCQAVEGIDSADVIGVLDHHRIGDITTSNPVQFLNFPWGSTATIVASQYKINDVPLTEQMARILLSAILTDTVIMKSPTTQEIDRQIVCYLAGLTGEDPVEFGIKLFKKRENIKNLTVEKIVGADAKEFKLGATTVLIAQHETVDLPSVLAREDEIRSHMKDLIAQKDYDFVLLMATDIMAEGSQFLCEGNRRVISRIFDINCTGKGGTWMPGVLSRKKQVAAKILS